MGYDYYQRDDVTEYMAEQRQRIAELEAENRALRAQLDALCRGKGIAVLINGRQIPLAALTAGHASGPHGRAPTPTAPPDLYHHPAQRVPMPAPHTPPPPSNAAAFPEDAWLTSPSPAAQPAQSAAQPVQRGHNTGAHALHPSERITPQWLREARHSPSSAPHSYPQQRPVVDRHPHGDAWSDSYSQPQFGTLAQITGQLPAARPQRRDPNARNPYADSFVLD